MRYSLVLFGACLLAAQGACSHGYHGPQAGPHGEHEACGCGCGGEHGPCDAHDGPGGPHDGPGGPREGGPHASCDGSHHGPPGPWHGFAMDNNLTLGLQEVLPRLHGHPFGPPPPPDGPKPSAVSRTFDFNDVVSITDANGKVGVRGMRANVTFREVGGVPSLDGTVALVGDVSANFQLSALSGDGPGRCMWPTAGKAVRTDGNGSAHTLVFTGECGKATLDGKAVTLPEWPVPPFMGPHGPHGHGGPGCGCGHGAKDAGPGCGCDHDAKDAGPGCDCDHGAKDAGPGCGCEGHGGDHGPEHGEHGHPDHG